MWQNKGVIVIALNITRVASLAAVCSAYWFKRDGRSFGMYRKLDCKC